MFCCTLLYVHSSIAIILMGKRELVALLNLSSWRLMMVGWFFLAMPWVCLLFLIAVFPDHAHLLFCNHVEEEEKAGCFSIIVSQMYCYYKCSVALSHGAVGRFAVCDFGIS